MDDAVTRYCAASTAGDMEAMAATFAADVELPSPILGHATFKRQDVRAILTAVYSILGAVDWDAPVGNGTTRLAIAHTTILGLPIDDAMVFELNEQGKIRRIPASSATAPRDDRVRRHDRPARRRQADDDPARATPSLKAHRRGRPQSRRSP